MARLAKQFKPLNLTVAALLLLMAAGGFLWRNQQISTGILEKTRPADQTTLVFDYARLLRENEADLSRRLERIGKTYDVETVVVTVEDLPDQLTLDALAGQLMETWDIGRTRNGHGILILAASNARKVRLSVTAELVYAFPDSFLNQIQDWPWQTYFQKRELYTGIIRVLGDIESRARQVDNLGRSQK